MSSASALPDPWFCVTCKVRKNAGFFFMYSKVRKNAGFLFYTFIAHTYTDAFCRVIIGILRPCHAHAHRHTQAAATLHPSHTHIHTHTCTCTTGKPFAELERQSEDEIGAQ